MTRDLIIGIGLAAAVLLIALAVWPRPSGISGTVRSDTKGRYHVDLEPGTYCVVASKEGSGAFPTTANRGYVAVRAGQVTTVDLTLGIPMGICLAAQDTIATPAGPVLVSQLHPGMIIWTLGPTGQRLTAPLLLVSHTPAPQGHPIPDGRRVGDLNVGDTLDGSRIVRVDRVPYLGDTCDVLPAGPTGVYLAGDIP